MFGHSDWGEGATHLFEDAEKEWEEGRAKRIACGDKK
jgi:hypothetical protein